MWSKILWYQQKGRNCPIFFISGRKFTFRWYGEPIWQHLHWGSKATEKGLGGHFCLIAHFLPTYCSCFPKENSIFLPFCANNFNNQLLINSEESNIAKSSKHLRILLKKCNEKIQWWRRSYLYLDIFKSPLLLSQSDRIKAAWQIFHILLFSLFIVKLCPIYSQHPNI